MNPKMKEYLSKNHGLAADASDNDAQTMFDGLSADEQAKCKASMSSKAPPANTALSAQEAVAAAIAADPESVARLVEQAQLAKRRNVPADDVDNDARLIALETKRVGNIRSLAATLKPAEIPESLILKQIGSNATVEESRKAFLAHIHESCKPVDGVINVGTDQKIASLSSRMSDGIRIRAQAKVEKPVEGAQAMAQLSVIDMGRQYLSTLGHADAFNVSRLKVWEALMNPRAVGGQYAMLAQSTGSFLNITLDAINKTLRQAYLDGGRNWDRLFRRSTAADFKNINRVALSDAPALVSRQEGGEIKYAALSDSKEVYALTEYVNGIRLTRQAVINDDLDAFGRIPMLQGNSARRKEDDVAFAIVTANAALSDTGLLFNNTAVTTAGGHANYTSSGTAISVTSLGVARASMRVQTGPNGAVLNLIPRYLLVPAAQETLANQYTSPNFNPTQSSNINDFRAGGATPLMPVVEPRLDANSTTAWYLFADFGSVDTIEVCFLQDEPEPQLKQETDFDTDDVKFAVRHTVAAKAIDFRGAYKNAGA